MESRAKRGASLSSRIDSYPGREITSDDLEAQKYLSIAYNADLKYSWTAGVAISRYLDGLKAGQLWARKCKQCGRTLIPPRMYCEECYRPTDEWVRVKDTGRVNTFSVVYVNTDASRRKKPLLVSVIEIDGASPEMGILHLLGEVAPEKVRVGMKVKAVWRPKAERKGAITDIVYFRPTR
jgi:uncharacterized OB-fold protein